MNIFGLYITTARNRKIESKEIDDEIHDLCGTHDEVVEQKTEKFDKALRKANNRFDALVENKIVECEARIDKLKEKHVEQIEEIRTEQQNLHIAITKKLIDENVRMKLKLAGVILPTARKAGK